MTKVLDKKKAAGREKRTNAETAANRRPGQISDAEGVFKRILEVSAPAERKEPSPDDVKPIEVAFSEERRQQMESVAKAISDPDRIAGIAQKGGPSGSVLTMDPDLVGIWPHPPITGRPVVATKPWLELWKVPPYSLGYWERVDAGPYREDELPMMVSPEGGAARGHLGGFDYEFAGASPLDGSIEVACQLGKLDEYPVTILEDIDPAQHDLLFGGTRMVQAAIGFRFFFPGPLSRAQCIQVDADLNLGTTAGRPTGSRPEFLSSLRAGANYNALFGLVWNRLTAALQISAYDNQVWPGTNAIVKARGVLHEKTQRLVQTSTPNHYDQWGLETTNGAISLSQRIFLSAGAPFVDVLVTGAAVSLVASELNPQNQLSWYGVQVQGEPDPDPGRASFKAVKEDRYELNYGGSSLEHMGYDDGCVWLNRLRFSFYDFSAE